MTRIWKAILCFFCSCFFLSSARADLDFFSRLYLSNMQYAKNIEVQTYLVTKEQIIELFTQDKVVQKINRELGADKIFLVVRMKNNGELNAFGTLNCSVPFCNVPIIITAIDLDGSMNSYSNWVVPLGYLYVPHDSLISIVNYSWENLYAK